MVMKWNPRNGLVRWVFIPLRVLSVVPMWCRYYRDSKKFNPLDHIGITNDVSVLPRVPSVVPM
jgi:hypothetical protein